MYAYIKYYTLPSVNLKEIIVRVRICLRIDFCDEHVTQDLSHISGVIFLIHNYYILLEVQYFSLSEHTSRKEIGHELSNQ